MQRQMTTDWNFGTLLHRALSRLLPLFALLAVDNPRLMGLDTLQPGGTMTISQTLDVNLVFIGFTQGPAASQIQESILRAQLPQTYRPVHRYPTFYAESPKFVGLTYNYNYITRYTPPTFDDAFFGFLAGKAVPTPLTTAQQTYNNEPGRGVTVTANHTIQAIDVEKWLATNARPMLGIDTSKYTVFLINWHGRPDFKFHIYRKSDEPDPDTGVNQGLFEINALSAWGGTPPDDPQSGLGSLHRIWFYDFSAGPVYAAGNHILSAPDLNGDGIEDYRIHAIWDYGQSQGSRYRPFNSLTADLAKLVRYVAIDSLFTTSPLYNPMLSPPLAPASIKLNLNLYQAEPGFDATTQIKPSLVASKLAALRPGNSFSYSLRELQQSSRDVQITDCFSTSLVSFPGSSCFGNRLWTSFGDLYLYYNDQINQFLTGGADYEIPVFLWNFLNDPPQGVMAFADDNWSDGTQSYIFQFNGKNMRRYGMGYSVVLTHEIGHHLGLSHTHDAYDYETNRDFSSFEGEFYFAWSGDMCNSAMGYLFSGLDFSQFDRDNMNRWLTIGYLNQANVILGDISKTPRAAQASPFISAADSSATSAVNAFAAMDYARAAEHAAGAYSRIVAAAAQAGVKIEPQAYKASYKAKGMSPKFIDRVPYERLGAYR